VKCGERVGALLAAVVSLASCASPRAPRTPPDEDDRKLDEKACADVGAYANDPPTRFEKALERWMDDGASRVEAIASLQGACGSTENDAVHGDPEACVLLGAIFEVGDGVTADLARARAYYWRSTKGSAPLDLRGCELDARLTTVGIDSNDSACDRIGRECPSTCRTTCARAASRARTVFERLEKRCNAGRAAACLVVATQLAYGSYLDGVGYVVQHAPERAHTLYGALCERGVGSACTSVASARPREADILLRRGCDRGDGLACFYLARRVGRPEELVTYEKSCANGMVRVCADLADRFEKGQGVPVDAVKAAHMRRLSQPTRE
jgi:TPR repeat protein